MNQRQHLTFKGNIDHPRHDWLRLTPAYSQGLVRSILREYSPDKYSVLDPFCGSATTSLVCMQLGFDTDSIEINPFLTWFGNVKLTNYPEIDQQELRKIWSIAIKYGLSRTDITPKVPPIHNVDRWWTPRTQFILGRIKESLDSQFDKIGINQHNLLLIAFLQVVEKTANIKRGHQSLSFGDGAEEFSNDEIETISEEAILEIIQGLEIKLKGKGKVSLGDSINLEKIPSNHNLVITSPPYCNRMSYVRELRPFMYWTGHLIEKKDAANLDWKSIGGTWGKATSSLEDWKPTLDLPSSVNMESIRSRVIAAAESRGKKSGPLLATYIHKYLHDIYSHLTSIRKLLQEEGLCMHYIVGNSVFYGVEVPIHELIGTMMDDLGFENIRINKIRSRNSKTELYEYDVSVNGAIIDYEAQEIESE